MIYITGDTHIPIDINKLSTTKFAKQKSLSEKDYVIICGDFGGIWDRSNEEKYWLKWLTNKNFTTLFIDGNHENYQMLNEEFPIVHFYNGSAHKINDKIFHLIRGQVFFIENKKIFTMGGASSHDKEYRKEGKSWWPQEMPSQQEYQIATDNLNAHNWKVDYIVTHCAPNSIQRQVKIGYEENELTSFFECVKEKLSFKKWFFGHYHTDRQIDEKYICLFDKIIEMN
jgi:DNA repair exonuclease SbcCD nuclease subunit